MKLNFLKKNQMYACIYVLMTRFIRQFWTFSGEAMEDKFPKILMSRLDKWLWQGISQGIQPELLRKCPDNLLDIWFRVVFERRKVKLKNIQLSFFFSAVGSYCP